MEAHQIEVGAGGDLQSIGRLDSGSTLAESEYLDNPQKSIRGPYEKQNVRPLAGLMFRAWAAESLMKRL